MRPVRVRVVTDCWSLTDERGNEKQLREGWEGQRLAVNGERVTVKFDNPGKADVKCTLAKPVDVHVTKIQRVDYEELKPE